MENPGRNLVQNGLLIAHYDSVAGIRAALKTNDYIGILGEDINYFSLSFIAPLGADNYDIGHSKSLV
jgi:hypothetical protein